MKTFENGTIRVNLTDEQFESFGGGRSDILSHAMMVLGNRSESALMENETPDENDIKKTAIENLTIDFLSDHCHYNVNDIIMRMTTGRIMSQGMQRDVETARAYAEREFTENPTPALTAARESIARQIESERSYRRSRSNCGWQIEIIGVMPQQIGMCRYQEVAA